MSSMKSLMRAAVAEGLAGVRRAFRAALTSRSDGAGSQLVQASGLADETLQAAELFQQFGFTSAPPAGTELIVLPLGGRTSHSVVIATEAAAYRVDVTDGEACIYNMYGDKVHLKNGLVDIETKTLKVKASEQVIFETPNISMAATGGGAAAASMTGSLKISGDVTTGGTVTSTGDHTAGGISLQHHTHTGDSGGTTGEPK